MPKTITKTVYSFAELQELHKQKKITGEAFERAKQWLSEANTDHDWWESTYETWGDALDQIGFCDADFQFSGFWCQGDGASFTANVDVKRLVNFFATNIKPTEVIAPLPEKLFDHDEDFRGWLVKAIGGKATLVKYRKLLKIEDAMSVKVKRISHHYSHENTCGVECDSDWQRETPALQKLLNDFEKDVEELRYKICKAIYKDLEKEYYYQTSEEVLADFASANEYTFTIRGEREG